MTRHRKRRVSLKSVYIWHRHLGVAAALLVLLLSITGILVNHTDTFRFGQRYIQNDWLLDWYGIKVTAKSTTYLAGKHNVTHLASHIFIDTRIVDNEHTSLTGAVVLTEHLLVATDKYLLLVTPEAELVERLKPDIGSNFHIRALGVDKNQVYLKTTAGIFESNYDLLSWRRQLENRGNFQWKQPALTPPLLRNQLSQKVRHRLVTIERFLLDIHSGRLFSRYGPLLMDAAAIILIFLSVSGFVLWWRQHLKRRDQQRRRPKSGPAQASL